ncbi:MAG: hypothetical protein MZV63_64945 [Marinilabiliales bacterium]|nr:hypothetical protein [Marinilabiliales bacterium]
MPRAACSIRHPANERGLDRRRASSTTGPSRIFSGRDDPAAEEDLLGIEQVDDDAQADAQPVGELPEALEGGRIARLGQEVDLPGLGDVHPAREGLEIADEPGGRGLGLEAAAAAAGAGLALGIDRDMADLAGETALALPELAVEDEARADARPDGQQDETADAPSGAVLEFSEGGHVGVVAGPDGHLDELAQGPDERVAVEARAVGRLEDLPFPDAVKPGDPEAAGPDRAGSLPLEGRPGVLEGGQDALDRLGAADLAPVDQAPVAVDEAVLDVGAADVEAGV